VKRRAALAGERVGVSGQRRRELAGGKRVEGAKAALEFRSRQKAFPIEAPEEIVSGAVTLL
jgi:hypothetical protein